MAVDNGGNGGRVVAVATVLAAALVLAATSISGLHVSIFSSDLFNDLRWGLGLAADDPFLAELQAKAAANCAGTRTCENQTGLLMLSQLRWTHPVISLAAQWLQGFAETHGLLVAVAMAVARGTLLMLAIAVPLFVVGALCTPPAVRPLVGVLALTTSMIGFFLGLPPLPMPELMENPYFYWGGRLHMAMSLAVAVGFLVLLVAARPKWRQWSLDRLRPPLAWLATNRAEAVLAGLAVAALLARMTLGIGAVGQAVALFAWLGLFAVVCIRRAVPFPAALAGAVLLFSATGMEFFYFYAAYPTPNGAMSLAATGIVTYALFRPNGRLVWLLLLLPVLHMGASGMLATAIVLAEATMALVRRRRPSMLILPALLVVVVTRLWSSTQFAGLAQNVDLLALAGTILTASPRHFLIPLMVLAAMGMVAVVLLRAGRDLDPMARFALLAFQVAGWMQLSTLLLKSGIDRNDIDYSIFVYAGDYLAPALGFGAPLVIYGTLLLAAPAGAVPRAVPRGVATMMVASFVFLIVGRCFTPLHLGGTFAEGLARGVAIITDPAGVRPHDPMLAEVTLDDDRYLLRQSPEPRANDPMTAAAVLKLALRQNAGTFDPVRAHIDVHDIRDATDWWARHGRFVDHIRVDGGD